MIRSICSAAAVAAALAASSGPARAGWEFERGVSVPSYAVTAPRLSELNLDTVVLTCEQGPQRRGLQLRLYLTGDGPLAPRGIATPADASPTLELAIDGVRHDARLYFADDFVVLADAVDGFLPVLSPSLLDSLEQGRRLGLRFAFGPAQATAVVDLQPDPGGAAVSAMRRCADSVPQSLGGTNM
jgi:hypothetical protein